MIYISWMQMTIKESFDVVYQLKKIRSKGGATYKKVTAMLEQEATTHNIAEALKLLDRLKGK